jgi:hypothetical protein
MEKLKCPWPGCEKLFDTDRGLAQHRRRATHFDEKVCSFYYKRESNTEISTHTLFNSNAQILRSFSPIQTFQILHRILTAQEKRATT